MLTVAETPINEMHNLRLQQTCVDEPRLISAHTLHRFLNYFAPGGMLEVPRVNPTTVPTAAAPAASNPTLINKE